LFVISWMMTNQRRNNLWFFKKIHRRQTRRIHFYFPFSCCFASVLKKILFPIDNG